MAIGIGRSAARRAASIARNLTAHQQNRARIQALRSNAALLGKAAATSGAYGLPGMESSGIQGIRSSLVTPMKVSAANARWESAMARMAQKEAARAQKKAGIAKAVISGATLAYGAYQDSKVGVLDVAQGDETVETSLFDKVVSGIKGAGKGALDALGLAGSVASIVDNVATVSVPEVNVNAGYVTGTNVGAAQVANNASIPTRNSINRNAYNLRNVNAGAFS